MKYLLTTIEGTRYTISSDGVILSVNGNGYNDFRPSGEWLILGVSTRHNSRQILTLHDASMAGADIGQGWVHDLDHGTHRMWAHPSYRRAASIKRVPA